jgi:hypothetical protein
MVFVPFVFFVATLFVATVSFVSDFGSYNQKRASSERHREYCPQGSGSE